MRPRPVVVAHRGASGYLPEHTAEAKVLAYGMGADYLEQDVVASRDAELIVMHDIFLDDVTDVAQVFPGRARGDGHYYTIDFDLAELRELCVIERRRPGTREPMFPNRFRSDDARFRLSTLGEEIELIQGLNRSTGREVGIYPEVKEPQWHRTHGIDLSALLLNELERYGYKGQKAPVYVQCFDSQELRRMHSELGSELPLVQLLPEHAGQCQAMTKDSVAALEDYATGVGLPYDQTAPLMAMLRATRLIIHPYTFRRDKMPEWAGSFEELLREFFGNLRVDGLFCDHPDVAVRVRNSLYPQENMENRQRP
jgi:glycerophosphoryl diester phosphodiesterase